MTVYADLLRYRELFANLFRRDFQAKYKGSLLGVFWSLLNPLLLLVVYLVASKRLFGVRGGARAAHEACRPAERPLRQRGAVRAVKQQVVEGVAERILFGFPQSITAASVRRTKAASMASCSLHPDICHWPRIKERPGVCQCEIARRKCR